VLEKFKRRPLEQVLDVIHVSGDQVIEPNDIMALFDKAIAKV